MNKLTLVLGALLVVGNLQAKEVVTVPVAVEQEEIVVVEPEVEDAVLSTEPAVFKPTGSVGLEYRAYGNTEGHGDKISQTSTSQDEWNRGANKYSRLQTTFGIQATENFKLEGRIRDYNNLEKKDENSRVNTKEGTETRLRAYYKHSDLLTSRIEFKDYTSNNEYYEYQLRINPYKNEGGFIDNVIIAPKLGYKNYNNSGNYRNTLGTNIYLTGNLPLGFTWENNYYLDYNMYNHDALTTKVNSNGTLNTEDKEFTAAMELYLYKTLPIYTASNYTVDFNFEGGYDPYKFTQYKGLNSYEGTNRKDKESYSLYTTVDISLNYQLTPALAIKSGVGAEYRNWDIETQSEASHWRWQPFAYAAMNVNF